MRFWVSGFAMLIVVSPVLAGGGPALPLTDDDFEAVALPFSFPFYGNTYDEVFVGSNGFLTFGAGNTDFSETVGEFLGMEPRIAAYWDDFNPSAGGSVSVDEELGSLTVHYEDVPEFATTTSNTFSVTLHPTGMIDISWNGMASVDAIVGLSPGGGAPDPGPTDLSSSPLHLYGDSAIYETFTTGNPNDVAGSTIHFFVPEPASFGLLAMGAMAALRRRR